MGTNYSLYKIPNKQELDEIKNLIDDCKFIEAKSLIPDEIHIGKSSGGWEFLFNHNDWQYFDKSRSSIIEFISRCKVVNEYGVEITHKEFWEMVDSKKGGLNSERYSDRWNEIHPNERKPYYMTDGRKLEIEVDGLRFSTRTEFT